MQPSSAPSAASLRRQRMHDAVRELMAEQGFRISMDAVAARAGCSKQTLYSHFGSKQELLRSVVQEHLDMATARLDGDTDDDPRTALMEFAMQHLQRLSDPSVIAARQLLNAEAAQFPEEALALYRDGCETMQQRLAEWLRLAMQRGQLRHDDPHCAAELLMGMIMGLDFERQCFAVPHRDSDDRRRHWAEFTIEVFLRAFAADPSPSPASTHPNPVFPLSRP